MENLLASIQGALSNHLAGIVVTIVAIIVARYLKKLFELIEDKFNIEIDDKVEQYILDLTRKAIRIVWQTFVKDAKKNGKFNATAKKEALIKAADLVVTEARRSGFGDYINRRDIINDIESELVKVKNYNKTAEANNFAKKKVSKRGKK